MKKTTILTALFFFTLSAIAQQASIAGTVLRPDGTAAPGALMQLLDAQGQLIATTTVNAAGAYQFTGIPTGQEYTLVPEVPGLPLYEVSTLDIVVGAQHILNLNQLDTPLKLVAGDVNESGSLTTFDLINMRQLVLGAISNFPRDWLFLRTDIQFYNDQEPWLGFSGSSNTLLLEGDVAGFDFFAIKMGDLSW